MSQLASLFAQYGVDPFLETTSLLVVLLDLAFPCVSNQADVAFLMGTSFDGLERREAALDAFRVAITLDPDHAPARAALQRLLS